MDEPRRTTLRSVGRERLADRVAAEIREYIRANELRPGDRLAPERVLMAELGVGRSSVREALRALSALGLIEVRQGDGMYVRAPVDGPPRALFDVRERHALRNLVETRLGIEFAAVTAAATRSSADDLARLQAVLDQQAIDLAGADYDWEPLAFELAVVELTGNSWLYDIEVKLAEAWRSLSGDLRATIGRHHEWHAEHNAILASIRNGNVTQAQRLVMAHLSLDRVEEDLAAQAKPARRRTVSGPR
ncbi:MAG TPA: GntR family transcriptional regulator [Pseudonocardiaceae bacterium]|nr:GntR family transcriptional regulator [Pseudonocardiaceae bacterium]